MYVSRARWRLGMAHTIRRMLSEVTGFTRYIAEETANYARTMPPADALDAPLLYSIFFEVPPGRHGEFDDWHEQNHIPPLLESKGVLLVRRLRVMGGEPKSWTHLALHYLNDSRALPPPQFPWRAEDSLYHKHGSRQ